MLYLMRTQVFMCGNKRTSMIVANKIMIENGRGILIYYWVDLTEGTKIISELLDNIKNENIIKYVKVRFKNK